jgi:Ketopantoate hydroxymethyltransferase
MLLFQRNARFQRCLQSTNIVNNGIPLILNLTTKRIVGKPFTRSTYHGMLQREFRSDIQQQRSLVTYKSHCLNSLRSRGFQIPVSLRNRRNPLTQQQVCRGLKVSALSLISKRRQRQKITMITAYDFPSAIHVARANIDIVLVGDSVAMVELGHVTTQPITMNDMIHHCTAVERGVSFANVPNPPLLVGDMPFGSYEFDDTDIALQNAYRFVKEAGMDAVKLEVGDLYCI